MLETLAIRTKNRMEMLDITQKAQDILDRSGIQNGLCVVYVPHTTAGVTLNENADPDVRHDIIRYFSSLIPHDHGFKHVEGNSDAHIKTSLTGSSETILVEKGRLVLGTWQSLFFCEFDGPRSRKCYIKIIEG